ncbi:MAG TPA: acetate--CoA ligase family protein [Polyangiaceae bacterium]
MRSLVESYGVPCAAARVARTRADALSIAGELGYPVALKIVSQAVTHKSDVGGVRLDLTDPEELRRAYDVLESRASAARVSMDGALVQRMVPRGVELFVGMTRDAQVGPLIAFGVGGTMVELFGDVVFRIAPLGRVDADEMIEGIRARRVLDGYRGAPRVDRDALRAVLLAVSRLAVEMTEVSELDLNPLVALGADGLLAVDARVRVGK